MAGIKICRVGSVVANMNIIANAAQKLTNIRASADTKETANTNI
jgi:hypothetical protein